MGKIELLFLCGAKDFHAMDKFRLAYDFMGPEQVLLVTDTIQGEGQKSLLEHKYPVEYLYIIDWLTPNYQCSWTHLWRNIIKFALLPIQAKRLEILYEKYQPSVVHAVPMYYMLLCWYAGIPFIGTPQAGEILERPFRSKIYNFFAQKALFAASKILVDSKEMKETIFEYFSCESIILKNGFKTETALLRQSDPDNRFRVISVRGFQDIYQIHRIIKARDSSRSAPPLDLIFPFFDKNYLREVESLLRSDDIMHGLLNRDELYRFLGEALLVISIPTGDSSPRSVYESIFCGATVAITPMGFFDEMPSCMQSRVYIVDVEKYNWFDEAYDFAKQITSERYIPSEEALQMCDQELIFNKLFNNIYYPEMV